MSRATNNTSPVLLDTLNKHLENANYVDFYLDAIASINEQENAVTLKQENVVTLKLSPDELLNLPAVETKYNAGIWFFLLLLPQEILPPDGSNVENLRLNRELLSGTILRLSRSAAQDFELVESLLELLYAHRRKIGEMIRHAQLSQKARATRDGIADPDVAPRRSDKCVSSAARYRYSVFYSDPATYRSHAENTLVQLKIQLCDIINHSVEKAINECDTQSSMMLVHCWFGRIMNAPTLEALIKLFTIDTVENGDYFRGSVNPGYNDGQSRSIIQDFIRNDVPTDIPENVRECIRACCDTIADCLKLPHRTVPADALAAFEKFSQ